MQINLEELEDKLSYFDIKETNYLGLSPRYNKLKIRFNKTILNNSSSYIKEIINTKKAVLKHRIKLQKNLKKNRKENNFEIRRKTQENISFNSSLINSLENELFKLRFIEKTLIFLRKNKKVSFKVLNSSTTKSINILYSMFNKPIKTYFYTISADYSIENTYSAYNKSKSTHGSLDFYIKDIMDKLPKKVLQKKYRLEIIK